MADNFTLTRPLYLVDTGNGARIAIDGNSLIRRSTNASSPLSGMRTDSVGVKGSVVFEFILPEMTLSAGLFALLPWRLDTASAGTPMGRVDFDITVDGQTRLRSGTGTASIAQGPVCSLYDDGNPVHAYTYAARVPGIKVAQGAVLGFKLSLEVTVASGVANSTCGISFLHDPSNPFAAAIVEINI